MELPVLVKECDWFVYLNIHFCSFQFEEEELKEVSSTFFANIHQLGETLSWKRNSKSEKLQVGETPSRRNSMSEKLQVWKTLNWKRNSKWKKLRVRETPSARKFKCEKIWDGKETPSWRNSKSEKLQVQKPVGLGESGLFILGDLTWSFYNLEFLCTWSFSKSEFLQLGVSPTQVFMHLEFLRLGVSCTWSFFSISEFLQRGVSGTCSDLHLWFLALGVSPTGTGSFSNWDLQFLQLGLPFLSHEQRTSILHQLWLKWEFAGIILPAISNESISESHR